MNSCEAKQMMATEQTMPMELIKSINVAHPPVFVLEERGCEDYKKIKREKGTEERWIMTRVLGCDVFCLCG